MQMNREYMVQNPSRRNEYSYYHRKKAARAWRKNYEESGILEDREKWNELYDSFDKYKSPRFFKRSKYG